MHFFNAVLEKGDLLIENGGLHSAIFGSENLTAAQNIELGIRIDNNNEILGKLTLFFREIEEEATEIFRR